MKYKDSIIISFGLFLNSSLFCQSLSKSSEIDSMMNHIQKIWIQHQKDTSKWLYFDRGQYFTDILQNIISFNDLHKESDCLVNGIFSNLLRNRANKLLTLDSRTCVIEKAGNIYNVYFSSSLCRMEIRLITNEKLIIATSESDDCNILIEEEYTPYQY